MITFSPLDLLKNKFAELKSVPDLEPNLILEYEKAIMILEIIYDNGPVKKENDPINIKNLDSSTNKVIIKEPKTYFENFMEAQKSKNAKTK